MNVLMAVAPNGGIAIANLKNNSALDIDGQAYDPFGDTWHWTGRKQYIPAQVIANTMFYEQESEWEPTDRQRITETLKPNQVVELSDEPSLDMAHRVALEENDPYLMAIAGAKVIMCNMYNGAMTATFPDNSKAYINPVCRTVVPSD